MTTNTMSMLPSFPTQEEIRDMFDHGLNKVMGEIAEKEENYVEASIHYQQHAKMLSLVRPALPMFLIEEYYSKSRELADKAFLLKMANEVRDYDDEI